TNAVRVAVQDCKAGKERAAESAGDAGGRKPGTGDGASRPAPWCRGVRAEWDRRAPSNQRGEVHGERRSVPGRKRALGGIRPRERELEGGGAPDGPAIPRGGGAGGKRSSPAPRNALRRAGRVSRARHGWVGWYASAATPMVESRGCV